MELQEAVSQFLFHCRYEKNLSPKTLKAYSIDLRQFREYLAEHLEIATLPAVDKTALRAYIKSLFGPLKEKSVKRKVATLKALFHFLEREDAIAVNPFRKMEVRIKETRRLPRTITLEDLKRLFKYLYRQKSGQADRNDGWQFDPRRKNFTLLTLLLSLQASYAAPLILLAQNRQTDRDRVQYDQDRALSERVVADAEYLAREVAAMRVALGEVATRDYIRGELQRLQEEISPRSGDDESAEQAG